MSVPITAVLITLNAERHLDQVLGALAKVCAEIVVLDSGSTDATRAIAERHGARFSVHLFDGYGPQKRRAVSLASHPWVLSIDADEVLDATAQAAIAAFAGTDATTCWRIRRRNHVGTREVRYGSWNPDWCLRLFNRTVHTFTDAAVHESVQSTGAILTLPGSLLHYGYTDLVDVFRMPYHRLKATAYRGQRRTAASPALLLRAIWAFFHSYVLRRGFLDGQAGVVIALSASLNATVGLASASWDIDLDPHTRAAAAPTARMPTSH
jgi:glycosyltransferase involved in cell wall biosynthesis